MKKGQKQIDVEEALQTYGDMVYRLALVQMKNRSEAEDVFQEVFLRLVRYRDRIQGEDHLKPWLLRVTVNCCRKQFDSAYRKRTVHIEQEMAAEETYEMELPGNPVYDAVAGLPDDTLVFLTQKAIDTNNNHGTGCTLSAAIASGLGKGEDMVQAIRNAQAYLNRALAMSYAPGLGCGPVNHAAGLVSVLD